MIIQIDTSQDLTEWEAKILQEYISRARGGTSEAAEAPRGTEAPQEVSEASGRVFEEELARIIQLATDVVAAGQAAQVRQILKDLGIERVSAIDTLDDLDRFEKALNPWL